MSDHGASSPASSADPVRRAPGTAAPYGPPPPPPTGALPVPGAAGAPAAPGGAAIGPAPGRGPTTSLAASSPSDSPLGRFWQGYRSPASTAQLVGVAGVGVAGAVLLVGHRPGLGLALVGLALWVPAVPGLVRRRAHGDLALAAVSVALLAVVALRDAGWLVALCTTVAAVVGAVAATSSRSAASVLLAGATWAAALVRSMPWVTRTVAYSAGPRRAQALVVLRSAAVTTGLLLVFGLLFASADRVFASYLPELSADLLPAQVVVGAVVAVGAATLDDLGVAAPAGADLRRGPGRPARRGEWLVPVVALDVLVLGFVLVQLGALVGGHEYVRATAGLGYAEYAREGFGQLLAVTALTLVVVGVAARHAPRASTRDHVLGRAALGVLCLGTLGVVASALRRMDLYVDAFGLTRLRLVAVAVEVVLGLVLLLVMTAGARRPATARPDGSAERARPAAPWLPRAVVVAVAAGAFGLAAVAPDAVIVRHNTTADLEVPLDVAYLRGLSADAVPAAEALEEPLRSCVLEAMTVPEPTGVGDWNLARVLAVDALEAGAPVLAPDDGTCWDGSVR